MRDAATIVKEDPTWESLLKEDDDLSSEGIEENKEKKDDVQSEELGRMSEEGDQQSDEEVCIMKPSVVIFSGALKLSYMINKKNILVYTSLRYFQMLPPFIQKKIMPDLKMIKLEFAVPCHKTNPKQSYHQ